MYLSFCSGNVPFLLLLRFVKILNFMISREWIRDIGLGVCFGMVGFQSCLVSMEPLLGLLVLLIVLILLLNLRLVVTLLVFLLNGGPPVEFDAVEAASLLPDYPNVWTDGSLVLDEVTGASSSGAGFSLLTSLFLSGIIGVGAMLIRFARLVISSLVRVFVLFLGLSNLSKGLRCGVSFLLCSPLVQSILVLTI